MTAQPYVCTFISLRRHTQVHLKHASHFDTHNNTTMGLRPLRRVVIQTDEVAVATGRA